VARRRQLLISVFLISALLVLAVGLGVNVANDIRSWFRQGREQGLDRAIPPMGSSPDTPSRSRTEDGRHCAFAPVRPHYLPWVDPGERVPRPKEELTRRGSELYWDNPASKEPFYVALERTTAAPWQSRVNQSRKRSGGAKESSTWARLFSLHIEWLLQGSECTTWRSPSSCLKTSRLQLKRQKESSSRLQSHYVRSADLATAEHDDH
jgi:hypothetical protein